MGRIDNEMDGRGRTHERLKLMGGTVLAFLLLAFVTVIIGFKDDYYGRNDIASDVTDIQAGRQLSFIKSGKTVWEYLDTGGAPSLDRAGLQWTQAGYEASGFKEASGSFGSVDGEKSTRVDGALPVNLLNFTGSDGLPVPVYYFRMEFDAEDVEAISRISGSVQFDDAIVVYLNGEAVYSDNVPEEGFDGDSGYGAADIVDKSLTKTFALSDAGLLQGRNCVAVEVHQANKNSSDVYFDFKYLKGLEGQDADTSLDAEGVILQPGTSEKNRTVSWLTERKGAFVVQYCPASENFRTYVEVEMEAVQSEGMYCHKAELIKLAAGKEYAYRICEIKTGALSKAYTFSIPSAQLGVNFLFVGDPQIGAGEHMADDAAAWERTLEVGLAINKNAAFIISAGDQADSSDTEEALTQYQAFRAADVLKTLPVAVNRGNHDTTGELYDLQFSTINMSNTHDDYFMYQDVLFVIINSNNSKYEEHIDYLRKAIEKHDPRWIVVTMHYSMFSGGPHAQDDKIIALRNAYAEAFSRLHVDLVLSGHDHLYARSFLMDGLTSTGRSSGNKAAGETLYLAGTSSTGSKFYEKSAQMPDYIAFYDSETEKAPLISSISIAEDTLSIKTVRVTDLKIFDTCTLTK